MHRKTLLLAAAVLTTTPLFAAHGDEASAKLTLAHPTMVPGSTLSPGDYTIRVLDHLQDRYVVRIENSGDASRTLFIAIPSTALTATSSTGEVDWPRAPKNKTAIRGFVFANGGPSVEFVYPKAEAVSLATANGNKVMAVDPAAEGMKPKLSKLSPDEMKMVTLWMLTPKPVGADSAQPPVSAAKYNAPPSSTMVAGNSKPRAALRVLPHTASQLPLLGLIGLSATLIALLLRRKRRFNTHSVC